MGTDIDSSLEKFDLPDRYELDSILGEGGIGVVLKARDTVLNKIVAIKMLRSRLSANQAVRFHTEARTLARLNHPNILTALDFQITESGNPFLVLDFLEGEDLDSYIEREGPLELEEARSIFNQILDGLDYAHRQGIVHRDIKPSNIMLLQDHNGELLVKIVDFGLSKLFLGEHGDDTFDQKVTATGAMLGSPLYMSPEQARGQPAGPASDIYSLGCVFYRVLTGVPPFYDDTAIGTIKMRLEDLPPALSDLRPETEFDPELEAIVSSMLEQEPEKRPKTPAEIRRLIENLGNEEEREIEEVFPATTPGFIEDRSASRMVLYTVLVTVAVGLLGLFYFYQKSFDAERESKKINLLKSSIHVVEESSKSGTVEKAYERVNISISSIAPGRCVVKILGNAEDKHLVELAQKMGTDMRIVDLHLSDSKVTYEGLKELAAHPSTKEIKVINLSHSSLGNDDLAAIPLYANLRELILDDCKNVNDDGIKNLRGCKNLRSLQIQELHLGRAGYRYIAELPALIKLDMRHVKNLDGECMKALSSASRLTWIELAGSGSVRDGRVSNEALSACSSFKNLDKLCLENIEPEDLSAGLRGLGKVPRLTTVYMRSFRTLPEDLGDSLKVVKCLRELSIVSSPCINKELLESLTAVQQLQSLAIIDCPLEHMGTALTKLYSLKNLKRLILDPSAEIYRTELKRLLDPRVKLVFSSDG